MFAVLEDNSGLELGSESNMTLVVIEEESMDGNRDIKERTLCREDRDQSANK